MGPLPIGRKQYKFLIIIINYFTKWVEAEPTATIISDNGKQFDNPKFRKFCQDLGIKNHYSSPKHPQANGQTEVMNRSLLKIIKTRLEGAKGAWLEELPNVLWAYRTTTRVSIEETPFKLTFGTEAVIPMEIGLTNIRVKAYDE